MKFDLYKGNVNLKSITEFTIVNQYDRRTNLYVMPITLVGTMTEMERQNLCQELEEVLAISPEPMIRMCLFELYQTISRRI